LNNLDNKFGIVKHDKPAKYFDGRFVKLNYQMLNSLQSYYDFKKPTEQLVRNDGDLGELMFPTWEYSFGLYHDPKAIKYHVNLKNEIEYDDVDYDTETKNDLIFKLLNINENFPLSNLYHELKVEIVRAFINSIRKEGRVIVEGTHATVCANPVEMLYHSIMKKNGKGSQFDGTSKIGVGNVYSERFKFDKVIFAGRSPFITMGNIWLPTNKDNSEIKEYMNPTDQILYYNAINENSQQLNNGMDNDGDACLITNDRAMLALAGKHYGKFLVPTMDEKSMAAENEIYHYTDLDKSKLDSKTKDNYIGEIVNLSQELNSWLWHNLNENPEYDYTQLYLDISRLAVLSGAAIDSAKKNFDISFAAEIKRIRKRNDDLIKETKPKFFKHIKMQRKKKAEFSPDEIEKFEELIEESEADIKSGKICVLDYFAESDEDIGLIKRLDKYIKFCNKKNPFEYVNTTMDYIVSITNKLNYGLSRNNNENVLQVRDLIVDVDSHSVDNDEKKIIEKICEEIENVRNDIGKLWGIKKNKERDRAERKLQIENKKEELITFCNTQKLNRDILIGLLAKMDDKQICSKGKKLGFYFQILLNIEVDGIDGINKMIDFFDSRLAKMPDFAQNNA